MLLRLLCSHFTITSSCSGAAWEVRLAQRRDAGAVARVMRTAFRGDYALADGPLVNAQLATMELSLRLQLGEQLARPDHAAEAVLVADDGSPGGIVGCASVRLACFEDATGVKKGDSVQLAQLWPDQYTLLPYMSNLAIQPEARRRGLGRALVRGCEQQARAWGFSSLTMEVVCSNEAAIALYRRMGYMLHPCEEEVRLTVRRRFHFKQEWVPKLRLVKDLGLGASEDLQRLRAGSIA